MAEACTRFSKTVAMYQLCYARLCAGEWEGGAAGQGMTSSCGNFSLLRGLILQAVTSKHASALKYEHLNLSRLLKGGFHGSLQKRGTTI